MLAAPHNRDPIHKQRSSARRNDVLDRNTSSLLERSEIGHVPHSHDPFLPAELLVENRRVQSVLSRIRIQLSEPLIACIGLARLRNRSDHDRAENRPHRPRRNGITNNDLPLPLRIDEIVPILGGVDVFHRIAVVPDHLGSQIRPVPVVVRFTTLWINRSRPRRFIRLQQTFLRRPVERFRRRPEPHVCLRIRLLCAHALQDLLRAHVHPLYIDIRVRLLEPLLEVLEQLLPVRRVDDQYFAMIRAARPDHECANRDEPPSSPHHRTTKKAAMRRSFIECCCRRGGWRRCARYPARPRAAGGRGRAGRRCRSHAHRTPLE